MADDASISIRLDAALLAEANQKGVDPAALAERAIRREVAVLRSADDRAKAADAWAAQNEDFVRAHNERFARDGAWIEAWRAW